MNINKEKGLIYITLSSFTSATFGLFVKLAEPTLSIPFLIVMRFFIPLIICIPLFWYAGTFVKIKTSKQLKNGLLRGFYMVTSQYCFFYYISQSSLLNATMLYYTAPVFIPLISKYLLKDKSVKIFSKSIFLTLVGVGFIVQPDQSFLMSASLIGLLSGIFWAISQSMIAEAVQDRHFDEGLFFSFSISSCLAILILVIFYFKKIPDGFANLEKMSGLEWVFVFLMALFTSFSQYFRGLAYSHVKPYLLAPLLNLSVLFAFFYDLFVFKKTSDFLSIVGSLLIILGSILKWMSIRKTHKV